MGTRIKPDFKPHKRVFELVSDRLGITEESAREFCGHQLGVFILHFETREDSKAVKSNWNTAFYNWVIRQYEDHKEEVARHRELVPRQGNIFEETLGGVIAQDMPAPDKPRRVYRKPNLDPPPKTEAISSDEAFARLRKQGHLR